MLFVGPLYEGSTSLQRLNAFNDLGFKIATIDSSLEGEKEGSIGIFDKINIKLGYLIDNYSVNKKICAMIENTNIDLLWIDKGVQIKPQILNEVKELNKKIIIVGYSPDDMAAKHNQTKKYVKSIPMYDCLFTTKSYNVSEIRELGAKKVHFIGNAYAPEVHRPIDLSDEEKLFYGGGVGFIGNFEIDRYESMLNIAEKGVNIKIWGPKDWKAVRIHSSNLNFAGRPIYFEEYAKGICSFDINLCFLRKINRDLQTTRSVEIPACRAFMLAERTKEHQELFKEGVEAEYFSSNDELFEKIQFYLKNPEKRKKIAEAGYLRCLSSGYSYKERLKQMLDIIEVK